MEYISILTETGHTAKFAPIAFGGHCFYVRRVVKGKQVGECFFDREINGIIMPQQAYIHDRDKDGNPVFTTIRNLWDRTNIAEVIGKGHNVGKPCSQAHMHKFKRARWIDDNVKVGDLLLFPMEHLLGIKASPYAEYERFVEESVPLAIVPEELVCQT